MEFVHALYELRDAAYELPGLETVVFAGEREGTLRLFDVVAPELPPLSEILSRLPFGGLKHVEFGFIPDKFVQQFIVQDDEAPNGIHVGQRVSPLGRRLTASRTLLLRPPARGSRSYLSRTTERSQQMFPLLGERFRVRGNSPLKVRHTQSPPTTPH